MPKKCTTKVPPGQSSEINSLQLQENESSQGSMEKEGIASSLRMTKSHSIESMNNTNNINKTSHVKHRKSRHVKRFKQFNLSYILPSNSEIIDQSFKFQDHTLCASRKKHVASLFKNKKPSETKETNKIILNKFDSRFRVLQSRQYHEPPEELICPKEPKPIDLTLKNRAMRAISKVSRASTTSANSQLEKSQVQISSHQIPKQNQNQNQYHGAFE